MHVFTGARIFGRPARPRSRIFLGSALAAVIALGLASRSFAEQLPGFLAVHAGDALWTIAVFLTLAIAVPRWAPLTLGLAALGISVVVEFSQLIDADWLNSLRRTLPGRLLLGQGFLWIDLLRYLVGALLATAMDAASPGRGRIAGESTTSQESHVVRPCSQCPEERP